MTRKLGGFVHLVFAFASLAFHTDEKEAIEALKNNPDPGLTAKEAFKIRVDQEANRIMYDEQKNFSKLAPQSKRRERTKPTAAHRKAAQRRVIDRILDRNPWS